MSFFRRVREAVEREVENAGDALARVDLGPAIADLANDIGESGKEAVLTQANVLAVAAKESGSVSDNNSCRIMVTAGMAAWAATEATAAPWKAALTAGGGAAAAQIACDRIFPRG